MPINEPVRDPTPTERLMTAALIALGIMSTVYFAYHFFQPSLRGHGLLYGMLVAVVGYGIVRNLNLWYHYLEIQVPTPPPLGRDFAVDILTTYYPGEPREMTTATLRAIQRITYPHTAYLCDEADDPQLRAVCERLGVRHVTRASRVDAKAGNINNALQQATGEICLILDPDHVPAPDFLDHVLPYFQDERVGFVQVAQVYHNEQESLVAKGAAQQTYHFYGPMMTSMQAYGSVNAIGANCTFRRSALDAIGGHAAGLAEDMHTAMLLYERQYRSVFVPRVVAEGLVPESLEAYYHQQLKWTRGTLDLLAKVYPKVFPRLTPRQRLHYLLPSLHYLAGVFYLMGFLIPILALFFSVTPWRGDLLLFVLIAMPLLMSNFVIRFYIQKWLVADEERGFHIVGGLLEIGTWWVYLTGLAYTIVDKKIPYLPTAKDAHGGSHRAIAIPNAAVALVSVAAVAVGLYRDLTPHSIVMAAFASVTAAIMSFNVLLAFGTTNRNRRLQRRLPSPLLRGARWAKRHILASLNTMTVVVRRTAVPGLLVVGGSAALASVYLARAGWAGVNYIPDPMAVSPPIRLSGIFAPDATRGLSSEARLRHLRQARGLSFDLVSAYEPWGDTTRLAAIASAYDFPLVTWEPWVRTFARSRSSPELREGRKAFRSIGEGHFDDYILASARTLKASGKPVLLRFAHEFDNPFYPWSPSGDNTPREFVDAWRHVHALFEEAGATNVAWVWNPWKATGMEAYYPGDDYVDWVGLTALNYGPAFATIPDLSFAELYVPFRNRLAKFSRKPVLLAEFGTLGTQERKGEWVGEALATIDRDYPEIRAIVAFDSGLDVNQPAEGGAAEGELDWVLEDPAPIAAFSTATPELKLLDFDRPTPRPASVGTAGAAALPGRTVHFSTETAWGSSYQPLSRERLTRDFALMQEWSVDNIVIDDPGVYAHNLLTLGEEAGLKIVFEFGLPELAELLGGDGATPHGREAILSTVRRYRGEDVIEAWGFSQLQLDDIAARYEPPLTGAVVDAYRAWIAAIAGDIRAADPHRRVLTDAAAAGTIERWRDHWTFDRIGFDGLLDRHGRIKVTTGSPIAISRTARPVGPGDVSVYRATVLEGNRWVAPPGEDRHVTYEWSLVAKDKWGYYRSVKLVGQGPELELEIPEDYRRYELMLSAVTGDSVRSVRTSLNTPLQVR